MPPSTRHSTGAKGRAGLTKSSIPLGVGKVKDPPQARPSRLNPSERRLVRELREKYGARHSSKASPQELKKIASRKHTAQMLQEEEKAPSDPEEEEEEEGEEEEEEEEEPTRPSSNVRPNDGGAELEPNEGGLRAGKEEDGPTNVELDGNDGNEVGFYSMLLK
ncbi:hypothetical protein SCLCIDRAFT_1143694 [Scleroderma citrinum Foug A]|uniref:Uncharacterized protein n=1 Tax=Scleroderma citrinum Foug A TaxID=1036808 RepID=A0A0C2Z5A6_9AGAM|nr:hypothetical protein SCLCIDRAFT_1143694 [Scleroderma citrinum Foug A]